MLIDELILRTRDVTALHDFYMRVLGLTAVQEAGSRLTLQTGRSRLAFQQSDTAWHGYYHFAFDVPENQFAAAKAWLTARVPLIPDKDGQDHFHSDEWNSDSIYFYDPAGNILEFIARHNQANSSDHPFGPASIIAVTEIGLTCADVHATVEWLRSAMGIEVYADGEGEQFAPVGDEAGLLIVVRQGRIWFPDTGKPAVFAPLSLSLTTAPERRYRLTGPPYQLKQEQ
jgi:catechol-2,3-dioxygenase